MNDSPIAGSVTLDAENPWPGLHEFDERGRSFFNGRDEETAALFRHVRAATLTVLFARSGLGKTSLLKAGLFPLLRQEGYLPIYIHLDPLNQSAPLIAQVAHAFRNELETHCGEYPVLGKHESLWEYLHRPALELWSRKNRLLTPLFVFDQFEEVFTRGAENMAGVGALREDLADLVENRIPGPLARRQEEDDEHASTLNLQNQPYKVLLSFREDFLPDIEGWRPAIPSLMRNRLRLLPLNGTQAFAAVFKTGGNLVDEAISRDIVKFVAAARRDLGSVETAADGGIGQSEPPTAETAMEQLAIEPALLSLVCTGLNERRRATPGKERIDQALLKGTGRAIVTEFYEGCIAGLPAATRRFIEDELITEGGFRNPYPRQDAIAQHFITDADLEGLVKRRLLRVEPHMGTDRIELVHDLLTGVVREFRDRFRQEERQRTQEASQREQLEKLERQAREARRYRLWAVGLFVLLVIAATSGIWATVQKREAGQQRQVAQARALLASADRARDFDPELGALLALEAHDFLRQTDAPPQEVKRSLVVLSRAIAGMHTLTETRGLAVRGDVAAFSSTGTMLAVADSSHGIHLWDTADGRLIATFGGHTDRVASLAFSDDGKHLVSASWDMTARVWDVDAPGREPLILAGHEAGLLAATFNPGTGDLLTADWSGRVQRWDVRGPLPVLKGSALAVEAGSGAGALSSDGRWFAMAGADKTITIWDVAGRGKKTSLGPVSSDIAYLKFDRDGARIAAGGSDDKLHIWDIESGKRASDIRTLSGPVYLAEFSADGRMIAVAGVDNKVTLFDVASGRELLQLLGHRSRVQAAAFLPDDQGIVTVGLDTLVRTWQSEALAPPTSKLDLAGDNQTFDMAWFSPDASLVAAVSSTSLRPQVWDVASGRPLWSDATESQHTDRINNYAFSANNAYLVTAGEDKVAKVWNAKSGEFVTNLIDESHQGAITGVAFSPDELQAVTSSADGTVLIWDGGTGESKPFTRHGGRVSFVEFSRDGGLVVTASDDGTARILDVTDPKGFKELDHQGVGVTMATFSPDRGRVMTVGEDETIRIWDAASGKMQTLARSQANKVLSVAYSADGRWFVSAHVDGTVHVGSAASGEHLGSLPGHTTSVNHAVFLPDSRTVRTICADGSIRDITCEVCVAEGELTELARHKLARIKRQLTADEREIFGVDR